MLWQARVGSMRSLAGTYGARMQDMDNSQGTRYEAVMRQCRAIERHAAALRGGLMWLADDETARVRVERSLRALHEQLRQAEALARDFEEAPRDAA